MRILAFDHFFDQDLTALEAALEPGDELTRIAYRRLHRLTQRHFPASAFTGVADAYSDSNRQAWARYAPRAAMFAEWMAAAYVPDVFVTPTDSIFYVRPVISRFEELGIPTVVIQKETTISPMVMEHHSRSVGRHVPFMSAAMAVCSRRHREFWIRAGADPERIVVTGQPRFDVYADQRRKRRQRGGHAILYLSYDDVAYLPGDLGSEATDTWRTLRKQTESVLAAASTAGWEVVVKHHPQQPAQTEWLGRSVRRAPRDADTRVLIGEADVVIGFQSTAVFEAAASGARVFYCAWGPVFDANVQELIPFHEWPGVATHVRSASQLRLLLSEPGYEWTATPDLDLIEDHLGPIDGCASSRALALARSCLKPRRRPPRPTLRAYMTAVSQGLAGTMLGAGGALATRLRVPAAGRAVRVGGQWRTAGAEAISLVGRRLRSRRHLPPLGAEDGPDRTRDDPHIEDQ